MRDTARRGFGGTLRRTGVPPGLRPYLASHVLGRIPRRLPHDFRARYGYRPYLVEHFADADHAATCLRAANFLNS